MRKAKEYFIIFSIFITVIFIVDTIYAQSLAEIAKKEKERREKIKTPGKVITNETIQDHLQGKGNVPGTLEQGSEEATSEESGEKTESKETGAGEITDLEGNTESYWRNRIRSAQQRITDLEKQVDNIQSKLNALQMSFYTIDDPNQRQLLNTEIDKAFEELAQAKADLENAKQELEDTREEGRRKGALPGWIY